MKYCRNKKPHKVKLEIWPLAIFNHFMEKKFEVPRDMMLEAIMRGMY